MAAPYITAATALLKSINPLLSKAQIRDILISTSSRASNFDSRWGYGVPDVASATRRTLGKVRGHLLANRLTPLFSLYSAGAQDFAYTTSPQFALALYFDAYDPYDPVGPLVPGYDRFPGPVCTISPCDVPPPRASLYVFTTQAPPFPGAPALVPLYRMRYDPNLPHRCEVPLPPHIANRDFAYTTSEVGVLHFKENLVDPQGIGYEYDVIEAFVLPLCSPEPACIPPGAERILRYYHVARDDWAIFPESELPQFLAAGYQPPQTISSSIGYGFSGLDTDGDGLIDAAENLLGTNPNSSDSDCDSISDGDEVLRYQMSDPNPANHGYSDPLAGPCGLVVFSDSLESGNASNWTTVVGGT